MAIGQLKERSGGLCLRATLSMSAGIFAPDWAISKYVRMLRVAGSLGLSLRCFIKAHTEKDAFFFTFGLIIFLRPKFSTIIGDIYSMIFFH